MKSTVLIILVIILQAQASFYDEFTGAMTSVEKAFGKLLNDVVTDVKNTVHCTILAMEQVLAISGTVNESTTNNYECYENSEDSFNSPMTTESDYSSVRYSEDDINEQISSSISKVNDTLTNVFDNDGHERLREIKKLLQNETDRLTEVSRLLRQELEQISKRLKKDFDNANPNTSSLESLWNNMKILHELEINDKNSSEVNEIGEVLNEAMNVLHVNTTSNFTTDDDKIKVIIQELEHESQSNNVTRNKIETELSEWNYLKPVVRSSGYDISRQNSQILGDKKKKDEEILNYTSYLSPNTILDMKPFVDESQNNENAIDSQHIIPASRAVKDFSGLNTTAANLTKSDSSNTVSTTSETVSIDKILTEDTASSDSDSRTSDKDPNSTDIVSTDSGSTDTELMDSNSTKIEPIELDLTGIDSTDTDFVDLDSTDLGSIYDVVADLSSKETDSPTKPPDLTDLGLADDESDLDKTDTELINLSTLDTNTGLSDTILTGLSSTETDSGFRTEEDGFSTEFQSIDSDSSETYSSESDDISDESEFQFITSPIYNETDLASRYADSGAEDIDLDSSETYSSEFQFITRSIYNESDSRYADSGAEVTDSGSMEEEEEEDSIDFDTTDTDLTDSSLAYESSIDFGLTNVDFTDPFLSDNESIDLVSTDTDLKLSSVIVNESANSGSTNLDSSSTATITDSSQSGAADKVTTDLNQVDLLNSELTDSLVAAMTKEEHEKAVDQAKDIINSDTNTEVMLDKLFAEEINHELLDFDGRRR